MASRRTYLTALLILVAVTIAVQSWGRAPGQEQSKPSAAPMSASTTTKEANLIVANSYFLSPDINETC